MTSEHIVSVSEADFEYEVIAFSQQTPVVVDFWAEWCAPCRMLGPILERLAVEASGRFRLAKVNVDESPNLALRYNVRSIPLVKAFQDGQVVAEFVGAQPEPRVREFIRNLVPSKSDLMLEKAQSLLDSSQYSSAEENFREYLDKNPDSPSAIYGLAKSLLAQGHVVEAQKTLSEIPPSKEYALAQNLKPLVDALSRKTGESSFSDDLLEAAYHTALRLITLGNFEAALDGFLDILRQDKKYRNDEVRKVVLAIFELLGENNPITRQYRNELASVLF